jgi:hypothetical protein
MVMFNTSEFFGIAPKIPPRYLKDGFAQVAKNCEAIGNSLKPLKGLSAAIHALETSATKTIYKFGQDVTAENQHWFSWDTDVDVCRSQIAGDENEWTFYTGDGAPKATYAGIALGAGKLPAASRPLGLPAPATAPTVTAKTYVPKTEPAKIYISSAALSVLTTSYGLKVSLDNEASYTDVPLSATTAAVVATALNAVSGVNAKVDGGGVEVETDAGGRDVTLHLKFSDDTFAALLAYGADTVPEGPAEIYFNGYDIEQMRQWQATGGDRTLNVDIWLNGSVRVQFRRNSTESFNAGILASAINANASLTAFEDNGGVRVRSVAVGPSVGLFGNAFQGRTGYALTRRGDGVAAVPAKPAVLVIPPSVRLNLNTLDDLYYTVNNGAEARLELPGTTAAAVSGAFATVPGLTSTHDGTDVFVTTTAVGASAVIWFRYRTTRANIISATGKTLDAGVKETRVYVFTWVNKEAGLETESAPSPASASVDVYADQGVTISGFPAVPTGYAATHQRVYRSVDGTYLFTEEIPIATTSVDDDTEADDLGEELPSLDWSMPPAGLKGLVNLPNGIMAGFVGRDIYFSVPYRPYAWPEIYIQTVDFPIVGLGVLDTTLVVLTRGTPYFVQGSHPDSMVVVKTDIEQACVSKRSIVSIAGSVVYASPDGLVSVAPGGSKILTDSLMTRDQWQTMFAPHTIHAFEHDLKYFAFYASGSEQGGFILDFASGSLTVHDIYAACGFSELSTDKLFVANGTAVTRWNGGTAKTFVWRSKIRTFPHYIGFSSAQVEAESFPLTVRIYADGVLVHTQSVTERWPFRLPAKGGRDWEVEIESTPEVFNFVVAQSMEEMASA